MQSGLLRHRIQVLANAGDTQDANGEPTANWQSIATVWARISPLRGGPTALGAIPTTNLTVTHEIEIRYLAALTAECRIQFTTNGYPAGGATPTRIFTINSIRNLDERNIRQVIVATEVV